MSLFADYLTEREGKHVIEHEHGFATYKIFGKECYLVDIYVTPEQRRTGLAYALAEKVIDAGRAAGCEYLTGSVSPPAQGSHESLIRLIKWGMTLLRADKDMIYLVKRIA